MKGWQLTSGLASFCIVCTIGVVASVGAGHRVHD
jgi:hypothetical protein